MTPTSSLEAGRKKPPRNSETSSNSTPRETFALRSVRRQTRRQAPQQPQNQNVTPTATPPPPTVTVPRGEERAQTTQQSPGQNTTTISNRSTPFALPTLSNEDATNSQAGENNSPNKSEQPAIPQSREQQTSQTSDPTSSVLTDLLEQLKRAHPVDATQNPSTSLDELLQQLSNPNNAASDDTAISNNHTQAPYNSSSMSVQQGIALAQGLNIVLDGTDRPAPENQEKIKDIAHAVLADLNAIYHYEGDGLLGVTSHFGHELFDWLRSHPFANFRKESDKDAMREFIQKLSTKFQDDADFRRDCEALEANFIQEREDYPSNCARACLQIVSLFLHPETV